MKSWEDSNEDGMAESPTQEEGHKEGGLDLSLQALGPGNGGHFTGKKKTQGQGWMRLPSACIWPAMLEQA